MSDCDVLRARAEIVRAIRKFFDDQGFVEVETAVRIAAPAPEEHIDCPPVVGGGYLRASPELQMKKLLAAGMDKIYQIGPCFRDGEFGSRHRPEFTMIEWYRRGANYLDIKRDLEGLLGGEFVESSESSESSNQSNNRRIDESSNSPTGKMPVAPGKNRPIHCPPPPSLSTSLSTLFVRDAYREYAGWDPWTDWDQDRFDFDMATKIEPAIKAMGGGVFLMDYPPQAASLSKLRGDVAERWEFYYDGIELANCFTELCDCDEQAARFANAKAARQNLGEADYPIDKAFLETLPRIGSAAGVALGVDRLVMVLTGAKDIGSVRADE